MVYVTGPMDTVVTPVCRHCGDTFYARVVEIVAVHPEVTLEKEMCGRCGGIVGCDVRVVDVSPPVVPVGSRATGKSGVFRNYV